MKKLIVILLLSLVTGGITSCVDAVDTDPQTPEVQIDNPTGDEDEEEEAGPPAQS